MDERGGGEVKEDEGGGREKDEPGSSSSKIEAPVATGFLAASFFDET